MIEGLRFEEVGPRIQNSKNSNISKHSIPDDNNSNNHRNSSNICKK